MTSGYLAAQLQARQIAEQTGLSLREIAELDINEFARLVRGQTPAEAARAAFRAQDSRPHSSPGRSCGSSGRVPQGVDVVDGHGGGRAVPPGGGGEREYGNGIFGVHGSWADAARAKAGRSAMAGNRNTVSPASGARSSMMTGSITGAPPSGSARRATSSASDKASGAVPQSGTNPPPDQSQAGRHLPSPARLNQGERSEMSAPNPDPLSPMLADGIAPSRLGKRATVADTGTTGHSALPAHAAVRPARP